VDGNCVDMPSVPAHQDFKDKVHAKAYKATERGGVLWVYMGDPANMPELPPVVATLLPEAETRMRLMQRECNWLQGLEGDIDTSHFGFLHAGHVELEDLSDGHGMSHTVVNRAPELQCADADWGTTYVAFRRDVDGQMSYRYANFGFPFWTQAPNGPFQNYVTATAWVPMDDEHTLLVNFSWTKSTSFSAEPLKNGELMGGVGPVEYLPNTTDWLGRWRPVPNGANDYLIDREAQRDGRIYTGIVNIPMQDQAVTESMGAITDHSFEHMAPSDQMIARTRRRMLRAARAFAEQGIRPPGADDPDVFWDMQSGVFKIPEPADWQALYTEHLADAQRPRKAATP